MTCGSTTQPCPAYACTTCGRDMIVLVGEEPTDLRCHRCRMLPGWHKCPEMVTAIEATAVPIEGEPTEAAPC